MKWEMLPVRDDSASCSSRSNSQTSSAWFYLGVELLASISISIAVAFLKFIKTLLPKPPRSLRGDVVLIAGVNSRLGVLLAEEFVKGGCCVICVDTELKSAQTIATRLSRKYPPVRNIGPGHRKEDHRPAPRSVTRAYECDLYSREDIQAFARKVKDEVGRVDVLVTCVGETNCDIFETVSRTLMSHYWTIVTLLPTIMLSENANIVGVIPAVSNEDAYAGSKAAVAGLIESLGDIFNCHSKQLRFIAVSSKIHTCNSQEDKKTAEDIVEAVQMGQQSLKLNYISRITYRISRALYEGLDFITRHMDED